MLTQELNQLMTYIESAYGVDESILADLRSAIETYGSLCYDEGYDDSSDDHETGAFGAL